MRVLKKFPQPNTIKGQLHRALVWITFITGLCIFIPTLYIEYRQTIQHQNEEMKHYLNAQSYFFESWLAERSSDIHTIANFDFVKDYNFQKSQKFFQDFKEKTNFTDLIFVNKEGIVQVDTVTEYSKNGVSVDVNDRKYFQVAKKTKQPYITDILISKVTKQPIIAFASPILNAQQQFNGVVFGAVNLDIINQLLQESRVGFLGHAYIIDQEGTMLSEFNNKQQRSSGNYLVDDHILNAALKNKTSGLKLYKDANNKWVLAKSKPINGGKWFVISEIGLLEAYKPLINRILWITICLVVGSFFMIKMMLHLSKRIEEPIQQLLTGVRKVEQGFYEYQINDQQLTPYAQEFQELCASFNEMSDKVRKDTILLKELSITCQLTKLYNRRYLIEQGELVFQKCVEEQHHCSCIAIDIDFFKKVNDTYGHLIGDEVLKHVANIITNSVRKIDIVTRYGGEEFVILSPNTTLESAVKIAERVRQHVEDHPYTADFEINVTVSIGIAGYGDSENVSTFYELLDKADQALYIAKESGRNQLRICDKTGIIDTRQML
ncbi:diguanylate cyclase [Lysinibacillus sp. CNPSo 3705]|uniref:sensor domain-containing diguanylate cyclase n=1 Tax=Lysinibacillus sp. CNPSo 3705 TaxID=3028148 RepID=UPI0023641598|nr:diguanylate cyclase [Lysinibacillus sp. CNPSo 3705]MDD1503140.1 diguanylate cyclase [Lysinibacillus sp. CNPSo 3705]